MFKQLDGQNVIPRIKPLEPQSEVIREIDGLSAAICGLRNKLESTHERLTPILRNVPVAPITDATKSQTTPVDTVIGNLIRDKANEIRIMESAIDDMLYRIGV
jgi:hypothetical protein